MYFLSKMIPFKGAFVEFFSGKPPWESTPGCRRWESRTPTTQMPIKGSVQNAAPLLGLTERCAMGQKDKQRRDHLGVAPSR